MKRSEIIRLIQKEIYSITQDDILYDSFGFSRNLLDKLESAGMLPPCYRNPNGGCDNHQYKESCYMEWESEDEKK